MFSKTFFRGGIHPKENKLTAKKEIENAHIPKIVRIPMAQHLGAPAEVCVKVGDKVEEGQLIGKANGFISANVHSSVPGTVTAIIKDNTVTSKNVDYVEIKTHGEIKNWYLNVNNYENYSPDKYLEIIKNAGIVGMGGAGFPTHVKLTPPPGKKIKDLLINGAECEPYITSDHRLMLEKANEIIEGIKIISRILLTDNVYICIEENKPDAIKMFKSIIKKIKSIKIVKLKTRYPQGGEKQLIQAVLKKEVPTKGLPSDINALVENVATVYAIYEAVAYNKPLIDRIVTLSGSGIYKKGNYKVRIGTPISNLLEDYELKDRKSLIIAGGPMMGFEVNDLNIPILKTTNSILVLKQSQTYQPKSENPCLRCGKCVYSCPLGLRPNTIYKLVDNLKIDDAVNNGLLDCMECGSCAYVCPSELPLVGMIRFGKDYIKRLKSKKA